MRLHTAIAFGLAAPSDRVFLSFALAPGTISFEKNKVSGYPDTLGSGHRQ
jgi:hypothetical protein